MLYFWNELCIEKILEFYGDIVEYLFCLELF